MSAPANPPKERIVKIDNVRALRFAVTGERVDLSLLALGINTFSQSVSADVAIEAGNALLMFGTAAKAAKNA